MKKSALLLWTFLLGCLYVSAQSKVFKEVSEEISSQVAPIKQDDALVGYMVFARLEKATEDSFNYRITIMDENLNDIGTVNFREESIYLQGVAFEQDVLCLAYFKSNSYGKTFKNSRAFRAEEGNFKNAVVMQFLGLDGKIIKTHSTPVTVKMGYVSLYSGKKVQATGKMKNNIQLINIPQYGFACAYGDDDKNLLTLYKPNGDRLWQKKLKEEPTSSSLLAAGPSVYLIAKSRIQQEKPLLEVHSFGVPDSAVYPKYALKDKKGHELGVLNFDINPSTGKPFVSGYIKTLRSGTEHYSPLSISNGFYAGVYTCLINGHEKKDIKEVFTYWDDESNPSIARKGYFKDTRSYADFATAFMDHSGNTYFVGNSFKKKASVGGIIATVLTIPLITPPLAILALGGASPRAKLIDPILLKLDGKGGVTYETPIPTKQGSYTRANFPISYLGTRNFTSVTNRDTRQQYLIVDDGANTSIYNVNSKKVVRKVPAKDGHTLTKIFPAKEGHVMVAEHNRKEKFTRVSIESL